VTRSQITALVILTCLTLSVVVGALLLIGQGRLRMEQVAAYQSSLPTVTCTPTTTPIPTWTPTVAVVLPSPDSAREITQYLYGLSPLLEVHLALKAEMTILFTEMRGGQHCTSDPDYVEARSQSIVAAQDQLKYNMSALIPPRGLAPVHEYVLSSIAHAERANLFVFKRMPGN